MSGESVWKIDLSWVRRLSGLKNESERRGKGSRLTLAPLQTTICFVGLQVHDIVWVYLLGVNSGEDNGRFFVSW